MKFANIKKHITYYLSFLIPKNNNKWCFGAWMGERFSDNPRAFLSYMIKKHPENSYVWVINDLSIVEDQKDTEGIKFVKRNSFEAWKEIITSKYIVTSHAATDLGDLNWLGGTVGVQMWHGVAWKKIGVDAIKAEKKNAISKLKYRNKLSSYKLEHQGKFYIAPSEEYGRVMQSAFLINSDRLLYSGYPRNEILFKREIRDQYREEFFFKNNIAGEKYIVVYMPTFRDSGDEVFSFSTFNYSIPSNLIIIEKSHFVNRTKTNIHDRNELYNGNSYDSQQLLAMADYLITDYSSCLFDFLVTERPIIQFLYDYSKYSKDDRGLYYSKEEMDCGYIIETEEELFRQLIAVSEGKVWTTVKQNELKDKMMTFETENNSEKIYECITNKKGK